MTLQQQSPEYIGYKEFFRFFLEMSVFLEMSQSCWWSSHIPLRLYKRPRADYEIQTQGTHSAAQLNPPLPTPCATMATVMVAWAMATVAWAVAMTVAVVAMVMPATVHAALEDTGVLASTELF